MQIKLTFEHTLNHSLQQGDTIWYINEQNINQSGGYDVSNGNKTIKLGTVEEISNQYRAHQITISNSFSTTPANIMSQNLDNAFIMFSKDNGVNLTSLTGYYALAKLENNSKEKAELYAVGSEIAQSSK